MIVFRDCRQAWPLPGRVSEQSGGSKSNSEPGNGKDVIEPTRANWRKKVGHSKSLAVPWADAASQMKVTLGRSMNSEESYSFQICLV